MKDKIYQKAQKQVKKKKGFFVHLGVYLAVGLFFFLMNMLTDPSELWFFFPMLPWGIGLAIHYFTVFGFPGTGILTDDWEERQLREELRKRGYYNDQKALPPEHTDQEDELDLDEPRRIKEKRYDEDDIV